MALTSSLNTGTFALIFVVSMTIFGGWMIVIPAFLVAWTINLGVCHILNKTLPIPFGGAVVITGTSSGIGASATRQLVQEGWIVFAGVRRQEDFEKLKDTVPKEVQSRLIPVILDITCSSDIATAVTIVKQELRARDGILMGIINNAGYLEPGIIEMLPIEKWKQQFEVSVFGTVAVTQAFIPLLRETQAPQGYTKRIIFISSGFGRFVFPVCGIYAASKHALEATAVALRQELQHWPIKVILINPGVIRTNLDPLSHEANNRNFESYAHRVSNEVAAWYKPCIGKHDAFIANSKQQPTSVTDKEISCALRDSHPLCRYLAGSDVAVFFPISNFIPDIGLDHMVAKAFK